MKKLEKFRILTGVCGKTSKSQDTKKCRLGYIVYFRILTGPCGRVESLTAVIL